MTSRATSPRRLQSHNSFKKQENGMDSPVHPGRHSLRPIPEASTSKSSSASEQTDPGSPSRPPTPRGKKRAAAVYRQSENVDGNIGSASNTPEKPREKRSTLARVSSKGAAPWSSKVPVTASLARSFQETDAANKSLDNDSVGGTPTTTYRTPLIPTSGTSKSGSVEQTSRSLKFSGKPPLDSEASRTCFSSSNSSLLQSTPSRSVNRSLRYGVTPGSATSVGSTRAPGNVTKSSGSFQFGTSQLISAQQFDFEEDSTFWEDHNVQVILRTRPISSSESAMKGFSRCIRQENSHSITWLGQPETRFTFDHVAGEHVTQEKLFRVAGVPMVENCMAGYNSCMFCYGQTGSGKTHTMLGDIVDLEHQPSDDRGMTPRVFEYLFSKIQEEQESRTNEHLKFVCKCSFLEIFNEQITDLLEPTSTNLQVREGGKKGVYVENLSEVAVGSVQDVVHLLLLGAANRKVAATNMNRESSRSHSVFTCTIESKWEFNSMTNIRFGRLNLVDLAGSERQKTSGAEGERLKEAANINKSLSTLGLVIMILVDVANGKQRHVPYRDSKLTYLLQDSLGGNSKTTMIANISPSSCCALETLSTLKFAQRAKFIRNNAVVNEDASGDVNGLRQEIQELKEELDRIKRQDLPRTPSMQSISSVLQDSMRKGDSNLGMAMVAVDEQEQSRCSLDSWEFNKAFPGPRFPCKKLEAMEAVLAGALRREQEAEFSQRRQEAEIEQLTRLVKQREDDGQCSKMLLRFREDKIRRLEALSAGMMSTDIYLRQENDFLMNELRLMQEKADRNPELTRFAMENIRLLEQLRRFQDFYTGGEREAMADEISNLRDQLLEVLDSKLSLTALTSPQKEALAPELAAAQREIELLRIETDNYRREVEDCRKNLSSILEANSRITKQLDDSNAELREVKLENRVHQEELQTIRERVLDAEAIEWGHSQHLELISNLKIKLQQSEDRGNREVSLRLELEEQLSSSLQRAADLEEDLQETRGALDAAEVLVSGLQSAEADLSVAQEMATIAQNAVRQIRLETKEIAEDQRLSLKHTEDAVVAACMTEIELREELKEAQFLIQKLSSTNGESNCSMGSVTKNEQVQGNPVRRRTVSISQLEQDLKSLDLLFESGCTPPSTSSVDSRTGETENIANFFNEPSTTPREQSLYLEQGKDCILKLSFTQEIETVNDQSLLESELDTTGTEPKVTQAIISEPQGDRDLQVLQRNNIDHADLELVRAFRRLQEEIMKLKPQVKTDERRKADAKWSVTELVKELQSLILIVYSVREERKNLAAQNEALLKEKHDATKAHLEREAATSRLLEQLHEGEHALTDAVHEMEGILDDCLSQPTALDKGRVGERELMNVPQLDVTTTPIAKNKDTDQVKQAGGNDHFNGLKRNFAVCTTMLQWFSETLTEECSAKKNLKLQNDRAEEELWNKDRLISSLKMQLECALANLFEKDSLVSKLQNEHDGILTRLKEADAQVAAAVDMEAKLLDDIGKRRLELVSVLKRMDNTQLELAQEQDVLTSLRVEFTDSERERENLSMEKEQLAAIFAHDREILERSCTVATTMVWWLQSKIAVHEESQTLFYDDIAFQVRERDRMVSTLRDEITEKAMLLEKHMGNEKILANQNFEHMQEIDHIRKEIAEKDALSSVMQSRASKLQDELSASECLSMQLTMEKEKLQIHLSELAKNSENLQREVLSVQRDLEEADVKVMELATVQAGMLIVQEEWGLEKDGLQRGTIEVKQRCKQLEQELELARNVALKLETELEVANTQEISLREEGKKVVVALQEELKRTQISAEAFKDQLELTHKTTMELDSRIQKHLTEWEIEKETMSSAAVLAHDQCLEKDQALTSMQAFLATLQSQLSDACSRESKLSHELEEVLQLKENIHLENEMLRSKAEELVLNVSRKGEEISSLKQVLELKLEIVDDKVDDTHLQMKAILLDLDVLILMKEKLEAEAESIEQKILQHSSSVEHQLVTVNEDKIQLEELLGERENELLGVQSENVSFGVRVRALEDALEDSRILIKKKEEEMTLLHRDLTESESKAVKTHEKLRAANSLMKELARSEEQLKLQKEALAAENKRLTRCMACREMEFSSLQGQIEGLENSLKESHEKERMTSTTLSSLKEDLKVLEKQWQCERDQLKDRLVTSNRELMESQELNQGFYNALKELEDEVMATEMKSKMMISELETHWSIARGEMSNHLSQISLDFLEVKSCAEMTHLDLAQARSLISAADAAIEQLLGKNSALKGNNNQLLAKQKALQLELSRWEQYAVELHKNSGFDPSPCSDSNAIAVSSAIPFNNYFDILQTEVRKIRCECAKLRAHVVEKDRTILSVQMELSVTIASNRQMEIEFACVANERSDLKLQLININKALSNARDEVRCRDAELKKFECELHKVTEMLVKTEETMDESTRGWRQQIEEVMAEMEAVKLRASEKSSEVTMLRKQFEDGQATLQEAETLVNALVRANESARRDLLKWKSREEKMAFQSSEMLSMINEEVSVTMDHVEKHLQDMSLDIRGMRTLLMNICSETAADFDHEFKEFMRIQISEIERATEESHMKLAKLNMMSMDSEQRLHESAMENDALQISFNSTQALLLESQAALEDAMQDMELQQKGYSTTREELQGALSSLAGKNECISELNSACDRLSARNADLERLSKETYEELSTNLQISKEREMEKLALVEATKMLQAANNILHGQVKQLEMSLADAMSVKHVMDMEIVGLRQQKDYYEEETRKLRADVSASHDAIKAGAAKLLETEVIIQALNSDLVNSQNKTVCVQQSLEKAVTIMNGLRQHTQELEEKEMHFMAEAEAQRQAFESISEKLVQSEVEFDAAMRILATMLESTSSELHAAETLKADLEENNIKFSSMLASLQVAVSQIGQEKGFLLERISALDEDKKNLMERLETHSKQLCKQSMEASAASTTHELQLEILKTIIESASVEFQENDHMLFAIKEELEQSSARCVALDEEKKGLLDRLEIQSLQLCKLSQETSAASAAHQTELEGLQTTIDSASRELQEKELMILALKEELEQSGVRCVALDEEKKDLLDRLEIQSLQLCKLSQETSAASAAHQTELEDLQTTIDSASRELQEKELMILALKEELEQSGVRCVALDEEKKDLLDRLEIQSLQLCKLSQETSAASMAHQIELEILKAFIEHASIKMQDEDQLVSSLRDNLEKSSVETLRMLNSLETAMLASAQTQHERDEILATANNLETENTALGEEIEVKSRKCADLEKEILRLQTAHTTLLQELPTASCKQNLELEILTAMLESAVQESREKDLMASELENLLSQSQLQNAEMLQSSQEVVNHFSLFQSQLDACFQQNKELERNKLVLTAEVYSQSQEIAELKELRQASEKSLEELRISFSQLENRKDEEIRVLSDEVEKLKSQEAAMEVDLWDWEQRCQDTEVQLDEKVSELEILRGKLLATREEYKEQVELVDDELRQCQRRIAEMDSERREFLNGIEEGSSIVAELQSKLQRTENEMEEHFSRHSIEQDVLDSLENEKRELQFSVKHLTAEVAANQQRATAAENMVIETRLEMEALDRDLKQKDDLLQCLESDLNLLQESALQELRLNQELTLLRVTTGVLEQELIMQKERRTRLEIEIGQVTEEIVQTRNQAATWKGKAYELETELDKKQQTIESLEDELRVAEQNMASTLEEATIDLKDVENERDRLQIEVLELTEQLEMTQTMMEERDAVVSELHQAGELSRTHVKEKENEVELLTRSVHELESTVYALESQLGLLKREAERQRLLREDIEMESQKLNNHIFVTQSALEESNSRNAEELKGAFSALKEKERKVEEKESEISHLQRKLGNLEISSRDKDVQIKDAMAQISDLLLAAELQKVDFQQKLKGMESVIERSKSVNREIQYGCTTPNSNERASEVTSFEADLAPESQSQGDMTHVSCQYRIKELEVLASSRQKEVFTLNTRLAEAESMTHDVLRDLLGVKTDMNNVVSILGHQQIKQLAETACRKNVEAEEMETELSSLRSQLNAYIEERERWVEEINLRQCEMVAARVAAEKLRQKEQVLTDEIEKFRIENINHQEKIRELEMEIRKLPTSQQTFYQQINHHAKIREENQALKSANEELSKELRRTELLYAGMHDELMRYKSAESESTSDEEHLHLRHLLQEAEDSRAQGAQKLSGLCTAIMQAAGLSGSNTVDSSTAMDTLQLIENRLRTTEKELSESKHKMKFTGERRRRSDIRAKDSPLRSISNFTELLQRASSPSPAPR